MTNLSQTALGAWSGGRFMKFGAPLDDDRFQALLRPDDRIQTVITADTYGTGEADRSVGRSIAGLPRDSYNLVGAVGHDFVKGERVGAKGFPRFTNPDLRGPDEYASYLREATEASLERCGVDSFDLLLLHNPDRIGYTSPIVWEAMASLKQDGLTGAIGVAPGPANGFVLDLINCVETFGDLIDWAMVILNPLEPWPASYSLAACEANRVDVIARVADYGGLFHGDVKAGHPFLEFDHRNFRPDGWVEAGLAKIEQMRPYADEAGLTTLQLASAWNLSQPAIKCVVPTLIEEGVEGCRPVEAQREDLASLPADAGSILSPEALVAIREIGDNNGSMRLKGASPDHDGAEAADSWDLTDDLVGVGARWDVVPADLAKA
jgi:aryl-alcohol dehydrogenase-like predicted oxidoreductase